MLLLEPEPFLLLEPELAQVLLLFQELLLASLLELLAWLPELLLSLLAWLLA